MGGLSPEHVSIQLAKDLLERIYGVVFVKGSFCSRFGEKSKKVVRRMNYGPRLHTLLFLSTSFPLRSIKSKQYLRVTVAGNGVGGHSILGRTIGEREKSH